MSHTMTAVQRHPIRATGLILVALMVSMTAFFLSRHDTQAVLSPATFELDGNTHVTGATPHDWAQVFAPGTYGANGAVKAVFIPDFLPGADDQPRTGATKDVLDMNGWDCTAASLSPPKNDMANAFFADYTVTQGGVDHQIIYFGLDRINSDNGTADVGFWITKNNHSCNLGTGLWNNAKHSKGDALIVSEFTGGGSVSTIVVYKWCSPRGDLSDPGTPDLKCGDSNSTTVPAAGSGDGPLQKLISGGDCRNPDGTPSGFATGDVCATVNRTIATDGPEWPYVGAASNRICPAAARVTGGCKNYERGAFFEGGIDATDIFGTGLKCAGTFIADTRSSAATTSELHDFALGQVDLCSTTISTTIKNGTTTVTEVPKGTVVHDTATVTGAGGGSTAPTGTVTFHLYSDKTCTTEVTTGGWPQTVNLSTGTAVGSAVTVSSQDKTASASLSFAASYSGDSLYPAVTLDTVNGCEPLTTFNPSTLVSFSDQIVNLPNDATGSVTYAVFTDDQCQNAVTTGSPADGVITPSPNTVTGGVAPSSNSYTPVAPGGTFWIKAVFTGDGVYAGVTFPSCIEKVVITE